MKRTIVDLPDSDIRALDDRAKKNKVSRAALVRKAVAKYLKEEPVLENQGDEDPIQKYFGFAKDIPGAFDGLDGLEYQRKLRTENEDRLEKLWAPYGGLSDRQ